MDLLNKTVLITGASGFIGFNIVKIFAEHDWNIIAIVNNNKPEKLSNIKNIQIIQKDLAKGNLAKDIIQKADAVVHVAGLASDIGKDSYFRKVNFESIKNLALYSQKFIYISSTDVYGIKDFHGEDENELPFEINPINPYPKYKIESEKWLKSNINKDKYVIIRPADVWGEGDKTLEKRVIDFLETSPFIVHFGKWKGQNRWPLANVKNLAKVVYTCAVDSQFNGEAINIIDEKVTTIDEFYRQMAKKHFPNKSFKTITLPFWLGLVIGAISTVLSNFLNLKHPIFDPTIYAIYHVSHNLDFSHKKQNEVLKRYYKLHIKCC